MANKKNTELTNLVIQRWGHLIDKSKPYVYINEEFDWFPESEMLSEADFILPEENSKVSIDSEVGLYDDDDYMDDDMPFTKKDRSVSFSKKNEIGNTDDDDAIEFDPSVKHKNWFAGE